MKDARRASEPVFGIEFALTVTPLFIGYRVSQSAYGRLWVGRGEFTGVLPKRLSYKQMPGPRAGA